MAKTEFSKCECRHCAGPIEFPAGAGGQTVACPHCGQPTELPQLPVSASAKSRQIPGWGIAALWVVIAIVVIGLFLLKRPVGIPVAQTPLEKPVAAAPASAAQSKDETTTNDLAVSALKLEKTPGSSLVYVTGTVRNLSGKQRFGVKAEFGLSDSNGVATGLASDYMATLDPHGLWKFKALVMGSKAAKAKLNSIQEDQ